MYEPLLPVVHTLAPALSVVPESRKQFALEQLVSALHTKANSLLPEILGIDDLHEVLRELDPHMEEQEVDMTVLSGTEHVIQSALLQLHRILEKVRFTALHRAEDDTVQSLDGNDLSALTRL